MKPTQLQKGFTLVELIMVIVIMGVISGMVAVFMKSPIDAYMDSGRRAELTDIADTTVRRIARDIHKALPNSIRDDFSHQCLSFIPTRTGALYRTNASGGNALDFANLLGDDVFNMLSTNASLSADQKILPNDLIAIYNLGIPGADAYSYTGNTPNTALVSTVVDSGNEAIITLQAKKKFPFESPNRRFQVIPGDEKIVTFGCATDSTGVSNLYRAISTTMPMALPAACPGATGQILATKTSCTFDYSGSDLQRNALVRINLSVSSGGETVKLYQEVHVNNTP
jgi:MSHA biogenesis protein MshO